jgi:hypothetical protein
MMMVSSIRIILFLSVAYLQVTQVRATGKIPRIELVIEVSSIVPLDCTVAVVGSPFSTWFELKSFPIRNYVNGSANSFDIYTNAKITQAQFNSYNPGINCSLLQIGKRHTLLVLLELLIFNFFC